MNSQRRILMSDEVDKAAKLTQAILNLMNEEENPFVCQAAVVGVATIGCMTAADGDKLRAYGLADKLNLDIKLMLQNCQVQMRDTDDEDGTGVRD